MTAARQALVLDEDEGVRSRAGAALVALGYDLRCTADLDEARARARAGGLDLLVTGERVGGRLVHGLILLAEWRSPLLSTLLLSDRQEGELLDLLPSVRAVLPRAVDARALSRLAAPPCREEAAARLARRWAEAGGDGPEEAGAPGTAAEPSVAPTGAGRIDPQPGDAPPIRLAVLPGFLTRRTPPVAGAVGPAAPPPEARPAPTSTPLALAPGPRRLRLDLGLEPFEAAPPRRAASGGRRLHLA